MDRNQVKLILLYLFVFIIIIISTSKAFELGKKRVVSRNECKRTQPLVENYDKNGVQYLFFSERVTWEEAQMLCNSYDSQLAVLNTKDKALFIARLLSESNIEMNDAWIGGRRINFVWYWMDKDIEPWNHVILMEPNIENFPPWSRKPNRPTKECLAVNRQSHQNSSFIDIDCRLLKSFICEKKTEGLINNPIPSKSILINKSTFILYNGKVTWQEAAIFCRAKGFRLAIVKNLITTHLLANSMTKSRPDFEKMWIGAHFNYGQWVWLATGAILNTFTDESGYPPWRFGRPEENDGCLVLDKHIQLNSTFISTSCHNKRDFICEQYFDTDDNDWWNEPLKFTHNNNTYIIYPINKTWNESQSYCNDRGSFLAYLEHNETINLIIDAMGDHPQEISHIWLGGKYNNKLNEWFWIGNDKKIDNSNGTNLDKYEFLPWIDLEGENEIEKQNINYCLNLDRIDNAKPYIYGLDCNSKQSFLCQISCKIPPTVSNGIWNCSKSIENRKCNVQCNQNYILMGINNITCTPKNGWISGINSLEFPLCLNPIDYSIKLIDALSQNIQKSSAYYLLFYHSTIMRSLALKFFRWLFTAFPASNHLKIGMTAYLMNPPFYVPFNQNDSCPVLEALHKFVNIADEKINIVPDINKLNQEISTYDGRVASIIVIIDSERGLQFKDALLHFKSIGHYVTIIGLRKHLNDLLPLATIGANRRLNLYLFEEEEFQLIINQLDKSTKELRCQNRLDNKSDKLIVKISNELSTESTISSVKNSDNTEQPVYATPFEPSFSSETNFPSPDITIKQSTSESSIDSEYNYKNPEME
ncbi:uncharacterized protein [Chelonus insularis]|uniref:uncharacterized protein n=1 Tax=Chelonus insularis TaxID=460826 RepID=UPI00158850EA|nr:uncharacterized protein LOC118067195 [Chelonus insularis]